MTQATAKPYYQRVSYRLLKRLYSYINVAVGPKTVSVPLVDIAGLHLLHWHPEWHTTVVHQALGRRPGAFLDVGVNVGQTLFDFLSLNVPGSAYYGFEPNAHAVAYVNRLIELNRLSGIHVLPIGLSDSTRIEQLSTLADGSVFASNARINYGDSHQQPLRHMYIPCFTLDEIRPKLNIPPISVMKIDVEGEELAVLRGMTSVLTNDRPLILCEVLHRDTARYTEEAYLQLITKMKELLHTHGYSIYYIEKKGDSFLLKPLEQFPNQNFVEPSSWTQCDYLFAHGPLSEWGLEAYSARS